MSAKNKKGTNRFVVFFSSRWTKKLFWDSLGEKVISCFRLKNRKSEKLKLKYFTFIRNRLVFQNLFEWCIKRLYLITYDFGDYQIP